MGEVAEAGKNGYSEWIEEKEEVERSGCGCAGGWRWDWLRETSA